MSCGGFCKFHNSRATQKGDLSVSPNWELGGNSGHVPSQSGGAWDPVGVVTWGPASTAFVTLLEVEVCDGVAPTSIPQELGESKRLVGLGHRAQEPAWERGILEAGGKPHVLPVKVKPLDSLGLR